MNSIAAGSAADGHDPIAFLGALFDFVDRQQSSIATVDQRIAQIAGIEVDRSVDGGNTHAIAVVANASHNTLHHPPRVQHSWRQAGRIGIWRGKAKDVGIAERLGAQAGAHGIADHATDARIGTAIGFDSARMIVRFDFEHHVVFVIEFDDARIVRKHFDAPIFFAQSLANGLRGLKDGFLEHVLEVSRAILVGVGDAASQRLVATVFAPGLGDRFQFNIGWLAPQGMKILLHGLHLRQGQDTAALAC